MELSDLIAAVKAASTKDDLEALVKAELSIDLDKRKSLKALRAETLKGLGATDDETGDADDTGEDGEGVKGDEVASAGVTDGARDDAHGVKLEQGQSAAPGQAADFVDAITPPGLEGAPEPEIAPATGNRLLRNKVTGATFIWTPVLAKLPSMEEV